MKFRTDFVTNSSSASFILELNFTADNGNDASMDLAVSPEVCFSEDGNMGADRISLIPDQVEGTVSFSGKSIYSAKTIDELCDLLFTAATVVGWDGRGSTCEDKTFVIDGKLQYYENRDELVDFIEKSCGRVTDSVSRKTDYLINNDPASTSRKIKKAQELGIPIISEAEFMRRFDESRYNDHWDENDQWDIQSTVSAKEVAPKTIQSFLARCKDQGITTDNLTKICIRNSKFGTGDSAMWVSTRNSAFKAYRKRYRAAKEADKKKIYNEFLDFIYSDPVLEVNDNECELEPEMRCSWVDCFNMDKVEELLERYLKGTWDGHWLGTYSKVFTIDVKGKHVTESEILYLDG